MIKIADGEIVNDNFVYYIQFIETVKLVINFPNKPQRNRMGIHDEFEKQTFHREMGISDKLFFKRVEVSDEHCKQTVHKDYGTGNEV